MSASSAAASTAGSFATGSGGGAGGGEDAGLEQPATSIRTSDSERRGISLSLFENLASAFEVW